MGNMEDIMDYKKAYHDLLLADRMSLRERVVMEVVKMGYQEIDGSIRYAKELVHFIEGGISKPKPITTYTTRAEMVDQVRSPKKRGVKLGTIRGPYKKRRKKK